MSGVWGVGRGQDEREGKWGGGSWLLPVTRQCPGFQAINTNCERALSRSTPPPRTGRMAGSEGQRPACWSADISFSGITHPVVPQGPQDVQGWLRDEGGGGLGLLSLGTPEPLRARAFPAPGQEAADMHLALQVQLWPPEHRRWPTGGRPEVSAREGITCPGHVPPACLCVPSGEMRVPGLAHRVTTGCRVQALAAPGFVREGGEQKRGGKWRGWGEGVQGGGG